MQAWIFRFVSILGERYTHGHVFDFYRSLRRDPTRLRVLGDGRQRKSYLYVQDCIDAIFVAIDARGREGQHLQPRHGRVLPVERVDRLDLRAPGRRAGARLHRAATGAGSATTRSSSWTRPGSAALGWQPEAHDPRGRDPDAVATCRQTTRRCSTGTRMKVARPRPLASRIGHRRLPRARRARRDRAAIATRTTVTRLAGRPRADRRAGPGRLLSQGDRGRPAARSLRRCRRALATPTSLWVTFDTPVDDEDRADVEAVVRSVEALPHV